MLHALNRGDCCTPFNTLLSNLKRKPPCSNCLPPSCFLSCIAPLAGYQLKGCQKLYHNSAILCTAASSKCKQRQQLSCVLHTTC